MSYHLKIHGGAKIQIAKETQGEARKRQRDVQRQKDNGTYVPTLLERAKDELRAMSEPSIEILLLDESFQQGLDKETIGKLKVFVQNIRAKHRKSQYVAEELQLEDQQFKEKVKSFVNKKIDKLHQSILSQQTGDERAVVILEAIEKNLFDFLEYMDNYPVPSSDFLRIIIGLKDQLDEDSFTSLFVRVCSKNGGDPLVVTAIMVERAIRFLSEVETNQQAAYGLLRLVFINQISLTKIDVDMLTAFQQLYAHAIIRFFKSIGIKDDEIIPLLPATCFIFTTPMLEALKQGGSTLHYRLPPTLLPYLLEIISYSFCEDQEQFSNFLEVMRQGCKKHSHRLIKSDFTILLKALIRYTCQRRRGYFNTLKPHAEAIQRAFILLEERRIEYFIEETIENLLCGGEEGFQVMKQRPKILALRSADELKRISQEVQSLNQALDINLSCVDCNLQASEIPVFVALGITNMLPVQNLSFQLCTNFTPDSRRFLQYQTGQGKTALCLAIACYLNQLGRRVFIINDSEELTFRDYKKSQTIQEAIGIEFVHRLHSYHQKIHERAICYCTFEDISGTISNDQNFDAFGTTFIIDEFDSIFFEKRYNLVDILKGLNRAQQIIAFTGSAMQECHKAFIQTKLNGALMNMVPKTQFMMEAQTKNEKLYVTKKDLKDAILQECLEISLSVPIVLVCDELAQDLKRMLSQKGLAVEPLFELDVTATDSVLMTFIMRRKERFAIYILNHQQGRGVDFPSSCEIESNGGVHVIIVGLPQFYLQLRQFIGRTARIGNKGTYSLFEHDSKAKNSSSEVYFKNKIEELKNNAIIDLSLNTILNSSNNAPQQEEEKSTIPLAGTKRKHDESDLAEDEIASSKENQQIASSISTVTISSNDQDIQLVLSEKKSFSQNSPAASLQIIPSNQKRVDKDTLKQENKTSRQKIKQQGELSEIDKLYFKSYEAIEIHNEMLNDEARVDAYRTALSSLSEGKVVIDVGAGTGVLSMMAMDYGAQCVYAIERSLMSKTAEKNFSQRKDKRRLAIHCCLAEDFSLGKSKADLIVSEWMGYFLIYENMLPSVLAVRDKCLKKEGEIIPREASLFIAGYSGDIQIPQQLNEERVDNEFIEAFVGECMEIQIATCRQCILKLYLPTLQSFHNEFKSTVKLEAVKTTELSGLCSWFNCLLAAGVALDTSPFSKQTHWKQTLLPFNRKIKLSKGEIIQVTVHARPQLVNHRALDITIIVNGDPLPTELIQEYKLN